MKSKTTLILLVLCQLYVHHLKAQSPFICYFFSGNTKGAIGSNSIYKIDEDADSCIVFSTENGFIRYNGFEFIQYSQGAQEPEHRLPINRVFEIFTFKSNSWLVSPMYHQTIYFFDKFHKIHAVKLQKLDKYSADFQDGELLAFAALDSNFFIGISNNNKNKTVLFRQLGTELPQQIPFPKDFYQTFPHIDAHYGSQLVDTLHHVIGTYADGKWDKIPYQNVSYIENARNILASKDHIILNSIEQKNKDGSLIVLFDKKQKKEIARKYLPFGYIENILPNDKFFLHGINYQILDKNLEPLHSNFLSPRTLSITTSITPDTKGNLWLLVKGNDEIGVMTKSGILSKSQFWKVNVGVKKMTVDGKGRVWLFTGGGDILCYHDNRIDTVKLSLPFNRYPRAIVVRGNELWLGSSLDDRLVRLWIPALQFNKVNPIVRLNPKGDNVLGNFKNSWLFPKNITKTTHFALDVTVRDISVLKNNDLLLATDVEPCILSVHGQKSIELNPIGLHRPDVIYCTKYDEVNNHLWIGGGAGLYLSKTHIPEIPKLSINQIQVDSDGKVWVATDGEGLWIYDNFKHRATQLSHTAKTRVFDFLIEKEGVWVASNKGLTFKERDGKVRFYGFQAGLCSIFIYDIATNDSLIFLSTTNGFMRFNKDIFKQNYLKPSSLGFEYARIAGKSLLGNNPPNLFSHDENILEVEIKDNSLNLNLPDKKYEFHLLLNGNELLKKEDFNFEYKQMFPSLSAGDYQFYVVRKGLDGQNYGQTETIKFTISPPFWKSWTFIFLFLTGITTLLYAYFKGQRDMQKKINDLEMEALSSQINPHFLGNGITAIGSLLLSEKDPMKAYSYMVNFGDMVRQFMLSSKKRFIPVEEEINLLKNYLKIETLRFGNFTYTIENNTSKTTEIPAGMIQPFVENALKHGILNNTEIEKGLIKIEFTAENDTIQCSIEDNGQGINQIKSTKTSTHTSISIANINRRIELLNHSPKYRRAYLEVIDKSDISKEHGTIILITLIER